MEEVTVTILAPAHNEAGNVPELVRQVGEAGRALERLGASFEFVLVDDGSTDGTGAVATALKDGTDDTGVARPWLRVIAMQHTPPGKGNGQSAAFHAGFRAARGHWIATLDADLQNLPADIPALYSLALQESADMAQGDRSAARSQGDHWIRRVGSITGRLFRKWLLGDTIIDTGCSLRIMKHEVALRLPLEYKGMHRFIPGTARRMGFTVVEMPVRHQSRHAGETKYGAGVLTRAWPGLMDCFAVRWMHNRRRPVLGREVGVDDRSAAADGGHSS